MLRNEAERVGDTCIYDRGARQIDDVFGCIHATDALPSDVEFFENHQLDVATERGVPRGLATVVPRGWRQILPGVGHGIRGIVQEAIKTLPAFSANVNRAVRFGSRGRRSGRIQVDRIRHPIIGAKISAQTGAQAPLSVVEQIFEILCGRRQCGLPNVAAGVGPVGESHASADHGRFAWVVLIRDVQAGRAGIRCRELYRRREIVGARADLHGDLGQPRFVESLHCGTRMIQGCEGAVLAGRVRRSQSAAPGIVAVGGDVVSHRCWRRRASHREQRACLGGRAVIDRSNRFVSAGRIQRNHDVELKQAGGHEPCKR